MHKRPYAKETDFVFPSLKAAGRVPLSPSVFAADRLRPAALKAGVRIPDGHRFGLHNLRQSLSNWLVNKAMVAPKTVQSILRYSRIQTTLDIYTQGDGDETRGRKEHSSGTGNELGDGPVKDVNCGLNCRWVFWSDSAQTQENNGGRYGI